MYCQNCGKQIADNSTFCPYCGTNQKTTTKVTPTKQETPKKDTPYTKPTYPQNPKKPLPIAIIVGAIAIAIAAIVTVSFLLINSGSIKILDNIELKFEGYNNYGTFEITEKEGGDLYDSMQGILETYEENLLKTCSAGLDSKQCLKETQKALYLEQALYSLDYSYTISNDKPSDELSNGDTVTITLEYDEELFKQAGIKLSGTTKKFKVSGLKDPETIDLLPYIDAEWASSGGDFYLSPKISSESPLEDIPCEITEPDESGNATITINDKELARYGYIQKGENATKTINVGRKPQRIDYIDDSNRSDIINLVMDVLRDVHIGKCGWNLYTNKGEELILGLQESDITSLSASYGTIYVTININTDKNNTYRKSISFDAYIDQNGEYICATQFDTDSLGCGTIGKTWPDHD